MKMRVLICPFLLSLSAFCGDHSSKTANSNATLDPRKQFVLDVVRSAVALPVPDPQDRLRVLSAAADIVAPISAPMARRYGREGARLEADLLAHGRPPAASMIASGHIDCRNAAEFAESIPDAAVASAQQSLIAILTACPQQGLEPVRHKLEAALAHGNAAPRALLTAMEAQGLDSDWSRAQFVNLFDALPDNADDSARDAPNYAAVFARLANLVGRDTAAEAGLKMLRWLSESRDSNQRSLAVATTVAKLREVLGAEYEKTIGTDPVAATLAATAGHSTAVQPSSKPDTSALTAIKDGRDCTDVLAQEPSPRARTAAARGFANGTRGERTAAEHCFDVAFAAADEVWQQRDQQADAPAILGEVTEAAAQVDATAALRRAEQLRDGSAQAISMLAVARVVMGQQDK